MRVINPSDPPVPLTDAARAQIKALALRQHKASGVLMQVVSFLGGQVEDGLKLLPDKTRAKLDSAAARGLRASYDAAGRSKGGMGRFIATDRAHKALASVTGAIGGFGGLPTALAELLGAKARLANGSCPWGGGGGRHELHLCQLLHRHRPCSFRTTGIGADTWRRRRCDSVSRRPRAAQTSAAQGLNLRAQIITNGAAHRLIATCT